MILIIVVEQNLKTFLQLQITSQKSSLRERLPLKYTFQVCGVD